MGQLKITGQTTTGSLQFRPQTSISYMHEDFDSYTTQGGVSVAGITNEQSTGSVGLEIATKDEKLLFGLESFIRVQLDWNWLNEGNQTLASGAKLTLDEIGGTYGFGLRGVLAGVEELLPFGNVLEGSALNIEFSNAALKRDNKSRRIQAELQIPLR